MRETAGVKPDRSGRTDVASRSLRLKALVLPEPDPVDQLLSVTVRSNTIAGTILKQFLYNYDLAGNRTAEEILQTGASPSLSARTFEVNEANQLTTTSASTQLRFKGQLDELGSVTVGGAPAPLDSRDTNFVGWASVTTGTNVVSVAATDASGNSTTNQYEVVVTNGLPAKTFSHDANGNLTSVVTATSTNTFEWDAEDRLLAVDGGVNRSEFTYDGQGRRVRIVEKEDGETVSDRRFVWCGTALCEERDSTGATVIKRFFGAGEQVSGTNTFFLRDHLGSVREVTDTSENLLARYEYDPYGRRTKVSGDWDTDFGFTGHFFHEGSGLYLTLYRAYDPDTGRWLSKDPIGEEGGINLYEYCFNDPANKTDPFGWNIYTTVGKAIKVFTQARKGQKVIVQEIVHQNTKTTVATLKETLPGLVRNAEQGGPRVGIEAGGTTKSAEGIASHLSPTGEFEKWSQAPGYGRHTHPEGGEFRNVHIEKGLVGALAFALIPQAMRASSDPCSSAWDVGVAAAWDTAKAVDPVFLTDALEWIFSVRLEDF